MLRVGRRIYDNKTGAYVDPHYDGFTNIYVLTKSSEYGSLGPYVLKDDKNRIMENIWQASKIYEKVDSVELKYSRYDSTITWKWPAENHYDTKAKKILPAYWNWRKKLMENKYWVRYPVGFKNMSKCLFAMKEKEDGTVDETPLDYITARKQIYGKVYCALAKKEKQFAELKKRLESGENLLIIEVDGPHQESVKYYKEKYGVNNDFIVNNTMLINEKNIKIMLNDTTHCYGHGYCLAVALLGKDDEWHV